MTCFLFVILFSLWKHKELVKQILSNRNPLGLQRSMVDTESLKALKMAQQIGKGGGEGVQYPHRAKFPLTLST